MSKKKTCVHCGKTLGFIDTYADYPICSDCWKEGKHEIISKSEKLEKRIIKKRYDEHPKPSENTTAPLPKAFMTKGGLIFTSVLLFVAFLFIMPNLMIPLFFYGTILGFVVLMYHDIYQSKLFYGFVFFLASLAYCLMMLIQTKSFLGQRVLHLFWLDPLEGNYLPVSDFFYFNSWLFGVFGVCLGLWLIILSYIEKTKGTSIKCPMCAELILSDAKICKHCGYKIKNKDKNTSSILHDRNPINAFIVDDVYRNSVLNNFNVWMGLRTCKECDEEIYEMWSKCPKCGAAQQDEPSHKSNQVK